MLWRAALRHLLRHPWQTILALVGVALGVGVVTAVDLANQTAERSFRLSAETLAGRATHQVVGGPAGLSDDLYRVLRLEQGVRQSAPVVEGTVRALARPGSTLRLIGVDPLAETAVRTFSSHFPSGKVMETVIAKPGTALVLRETAGRLGGIIGQRFAIEVNGHRRDIALAGYLEAAPGPSRVGLESVIVTDIATAQELFGMDRHISRIDLVVPAGAEGEELLRKIRTTLPADAAIVPTGTRTGALERMTRAFRLNLTALSLLALVVGMFLIYNTTTFSVIRRRRLIGQLRAIGVTRRQVFAMIMGEVLLIGVVGTAAGILFGMLLSQELTRLVTRTINDLYFVMEVRSVHLLPVSLIKGGLLGIGATVAAAVPPVWEATTTTPRGVLSRSTIEAGRRKGAPLAAFAGVLTVVAGYAILTIDGLGITGGFAGLFAVIIGYALLIPGAVILFSRLFRPLMSMLLGVLGRMAVRGVVVSLSRTGVATAALVVAVSAGIGVGVMVDSFRLTVQRWLESWLRADFYVTTAGTGSGRGKAPLDPALVARLSQAPGAAVVSLTRRVTIETAAGTTDLLVMQQPKATFAGYRFKEGSAETAWNGFSGGEAVVVSEPFAYRHNLHAGGRVTLQTPQGLRAFPVAGIFYDYGSDAGIVAMSRAAYIRLWNDPSVDGMGFYARSGVGLAELAGQLRERAGESGVTIVSNRELRSASMAVFDRTFAITGVLRLLIVIVAFVGILSALMAIQVERARELAVARAVGLTPRQVWGLVCGETALIGLIAGLLSLPLGIFQAFALVQVINRRSFGWTMELSIDPAVLLQAVGLSLGAALVAGIYPSLAISRTSPALALKEEE